MILSGSIRDEDDTGFSITGTRSNGGWSNNDLVQLKIDAKGNISGEGVVSPYRMRFDGQLSAETLQLKIEQEQIKEDGVSTGVRKCSRIQWRVKSIANLFGGAMQMVQVPYCMN